MRPIPLHRASSFALATLLAAAAPLQAQWTQEGRGLSYREFRLPGPLRAFVARADRSVKGWTLDSMTSLGEIKGGRENVPDMVTRYNGSITLDGHRYAIQAAINGDYFDMRTGVTLSGQLMSGWFTHRYVEYAGGGFVWTSDGRCFIGGDINNDWKLQRVIFADKSTLRIDRLNEPRGDDHLAYYTPQFAADTGTSPEGVEVVVQVSAPIGIGPPPADGSGQIIAIRQNAGSTPLLFDQVVLSASGKPAQHLLQHAKIGDRISIDLALKDNGVERIKATPGNWLNAYSGIGGPKYVLVHGTIPKDWEAKAAKMAAEGKKSGAVVKDPRTAIAFNDKYVYFVVIDGRSEESTGLTFTETAEFCRDQLQATDATLQDGGGSSTLWLNGKVRNTPSGKIGQDKFGLLRPVANGMFFAQVLPPKRSDRFNSGQSVNLTEKESLHVGPGWIYGKAPAATGPAKITEHRLNGILAAGAYWWYCRSGETTGWAPLEQLSATASQQSNAP